MSKETILTVVFTLFCLSCTLTERSSETDCDSSVLVLDIVNIDWVVTDLDVQTSQ